MFQWLKNLDTEVLLWINQMNHPWLDEVMWFFSLTWPSYVLVFIFAYAFKRKYNTKKALEFLLGCALVFACTDITTNIVKNNVHRYRPTHNSEIQGKIHVIKNYKGGKYGFFSAHASNTWGVITYMYLCLHFISRHYRLLLFIYPFIVMYSRMYLGVHYPSDVLTGMISGILFGVLGYSLVNTYFLKFNEQES
jgi:undecaprenyl-diphosphatase